MAIRPVVKRGDPRLTVACRKITSFREAAGVIADLRDTLTFIETLYEFTRGSGIAANQIGADIAVSVLRFGGQEYVLCNPKIVQHSDRRIGVSEGCLSFFGVRGLVPRWASVVIEAKNERGEPYSLDSSDPNFASLLSHEYDHLQGLLYTDRLPLGTVLSPKAGVPDIP